MITGFIVFAIIASIAILATIPGEHSQSIKDIEERIDTIEKGIDTSNEAMENRCYVNREHIEKLEEVIQGECKHSVLERYERECFDPAIHYGTRSGYRCVRCGKEFPEFYRNDIVCVCEDETMPKTFKLREEGNILRTARLTKDRRVSVSKKITVGNIKK